MKRDGLWKQSTLLMPSGAVRDPEIKHLFIVLTEPLCEDDRVLLVNATTMRKDIAYDGACILRRGEHESIWRDSYIFYEMARIESARQLQIGIDQGEFIVKESMGEESFERICKGLEKSRKLPGRFLAFYRARCD